MRRALPLLLALPPLALAGCGAAKIASPAPRTVEGSFTLGTSSQGATTPAPAPATATATGTTGGGGGGGTPTGGGGTPTGGGGAPTGGASQGKALFASNGCSGCHTYQPAGATAKIGPDLDKLATYAQTAKMPLAAFTRESIVNPSAYVQPGYADIMPKTYKGLPKAQIDALVAFLTKK